MKPVFSWRQAVQKSELKPTTRHVLLNLSVRMNDAGESCYPSVETQSIETGLSKRAVIEHLALAIEDGWLKKRVHGYSGKGWKRNEYIACFPSRFTLLMQAEADENNTEEQGVNGGYAESPPESLRQLPSQHKVVTEGNTNSTKNSSSNNKKYNKNKSVLLTLADWEKAVGAELKIEMMADWVKKIRARPQDISALIDEFRLEMQSKGKLYVDFKATFQNWLNKGYLSKKLHELQATANPAPKSGVEFWDRGIRP